jgi:hypothetical protein
LCRRHFLRTVLGRNSGITEIGIAMVDQGYYFRIKFGSDYRIREIVTARSIC